MAHLRRSGGVIGAEMKFDGDMPIKTKKEHFLANNVNKLNFIYLLDDKLKEAICTVLHAESDADVLIVQTAVQCATKCVTTIIGEDTDILVLLCFHSELASFPIYFQSDIKRSSKHIRVWNINWMKTALGPSVCEVLPFVQAIAGFDTRSRLLRIGKGTLLKKLKSDPNFKKKLKSS